MPLGVCVLTISDRSFSDAAFDKSGPAIEEILQSVSDLTLVNAAIVPDDVDAIQAKVKEFLAKPDVRLILTTGGTGFGVRDRTPEAISPLLEREAPGIVHLLLSSSLAKTPFAALSRCVAGAIGDKLVITLPGSVKAVRENVQTLLEAGILVHALDLMSGGDGAQVHEKLANTRAEPHSGHHHHHHHHHHHGHSAPKPLTAALSHDPSLPVTARLRKSPFPLLPLEDALSLVLEHSRPLETVRTQVGPSLCGHVLAEDQHAAQDIPSTRTTSVDGYALRSTDPPGVYRVLTPQTHQLAHTLPTGSIYRINTGAALPVGCDAVIMVEDTVIETTDKDASGEDVEEKTVRTLAQAPALENVRQPGSDVKAGELVVRRGDLISASGGEVGTLAFIGRRQVVVYRKPVVAILSTGNEICDLHDPAQKNSTTDAWSGVYDTNRPALQAALAGLGYEVLDLGIAVDVVDAHIKVIKMGLAQADVLITTGGSSMGSTDLLKPVIERHLGGTIHFGRVSVKPGKPTTFATIPGTSGVQKLVFGLPGNPASAIVCFYLFVVPALRKLGGFPDNRCHLPRVRVVLRDSMKLDPRPEFHRVHIKRRADGLEAYSTGGQRSSRASSLCGANGLVALPSLAAGGPSSLAAGQYADAVVIGEIEA